MADTVKIDASRIGIKEPIAVVTTYANVRAALVLNRDVMQLEEDGEGKKPIEWINSNIALLDRVAEYISTTLKLKAKQAEKIQDLEVHEMTYFSRVISSAILHIDLSDEAEDNDQKSPNEK